MSEVKPREWFIYLNGEEPCLAFEDIEWAKDRDRIHKDDLINVIEKSVYDLLAAELESMKKERDEMRQQMLEAVAGRNQWRSDHLKIAKLTKAKDSNELKIRIAKVVKYCQPYVNMMWASRIIGILLDCDFRDADLEAEKFLEKQR